MGVANERVIARFYTMFTKSAHPPAPSGGATMARRDQRSGRGRRLGERRGDRGAPRAEETKNVSPRRRLTLERRGGQDRRSLGPLDAILKGGDDS